MEKVESCVFIEVNVTEHGSIHLCMKHGKQEQEETWRHEGLAQLDFFYKICYIINQIIGLKIKVKEGQK